MNCLVCEYYNSGLNKEGKYFNKCNLTSEENYCIYKGVDCISYEKEVKEANE